MTFLLSISILTLRRKTDLSFFPTIFRIIERNIIKMQKHQKIILVGGGTGWHVFPLINLTHFFEKSNPEISLHWIGEANSIESRVTTENKILFSPIVCGKLRRYFSFQTILVPFQVVIGILQSARIMLREKPTAIFSKGWYVSLPVAIAGSMLRIPVYLHESDSIPGLANRIVGRFATGIFCAFDEADNYFKKDKILWHGSLISPEIASIAG